MELLLTGATGFVGQQLIKELAKQELYDLKITTRLEKQASIPGIKVFPSKNLDADTDWEEALTGTQVVIHAAARAHVMKDKAISPLEEFKKINTDGTLNLARQAASLDVKRFIFISSIKVNGESTAMNQSFSASDLPNPQDPYAISKHLAEQGLQAISAQTGMEVVIIRPPLVYGPAAKGNFKRMLYCLQKGIPLPLGAIFNKRSFVALENLTSLISTCIHHPKAANQIFLVSDDEDLSTTEWLQRIGKIINKPARLIPIPQNLLQLTAKMLGQTAVFERLCGSLQLNIQETKEQLDWKPKQTINEALRMLAMLS